MTANTNHTNRRNRNNTRARLLLAASLMAITTASAAFAQNLTMSRDGVAFNDFDLQTVGETTVGDTIQMVIVLRNDGPDDVIFQDSPPVFLGGGQAIQFSLIQPALEVGSKLSPNSSTAFAVRYSPSSATVAGTQVFMNTSEGLRRFYVNGSAVEAQQEEPVEPNEPADNEPNNVDAQPDPNNADFADPNNADDVDPNQAAFDDPNIAQNDVEPDPNDLEEEYDYVDPNEINDDNEQYDDEKDEENDDEYAYDEFLDEADVLLPGPFCGFGAAFASMASLASLGGMKRRRAPRK